MYVGKLEAESVIHCREAKIFSYADDTFELLGISKFCTSLPITIKYAEVFR
jgi:hypothetical protein